MVLVTCCSVNGMWPYWDVAWNGVCGCVCVCVCVSVGLEGLLRGGEWRGDIWQRAAIQCWHRTLRLHATRGARGILGANIYRVTPAMFTHQHHNVIRWKNTIFSPNTRRIILNMHPGQNKEHLFLTAVVCGILAHIDHTHDISILFLFLL